MAFERKLSDFTTYAYTVDFNQKQQPLNVNFLDFFLHFPESPNQKEWENVRGGVKS